MQVAPTILLVDDNEHNCRMYKEMLSNDGYLVSTASDGVDAIHFYNMVHPDIDLVILDVDMPRVNGADCLRSMRELNHDLCCLAITAHIDHPCLTDMISQGISGILRKPFGSLELCKWAQRLAPKPVQLRSDSNYYPTDMYR